MKYRTDIDGLRAFAVVSVILFHLGFLPNGYLGVDVFFVISGYLITSIVYRESERGKFSIIHFYERRIRRIFPLALFTAAVALALGLYYMLPDDLENLCQGVVASNFSANNILMYLTSSDYWAVKNEYKPLMHFWSLGIEEQFYLLYPFLFFFFSGAKVRHVKPILMVLAVLSLAAFLWQDNVAATFYFIQYRFYELAIGGLGALLFREALIKHRGQGRALLYALTVALVAIMYLPLFASNEIRVISTTLLSVGVLIVGKEFFDTDRIYHAVMSNPVARFIGKISFSLYMWHQLVFAFARYAFLEEITPAWAVGLSALTFVLSVATYYGVENPFRKPQVMSTRLVLIVVGGVLVTTTTIALYVYTIGGIVRDYPTLGLYRDELPTKDNLFSSYGNIHIAYNENIKRIDRGFSDTLGLKVLVIGNSFGRDAANILLESRYADRLQVRYFELGRIMKDDSISVRMQQADRIVFGAQGPFGPELLDELEDTYGFTIDRNKVWVLGTKDFGYSNGIHYNRLTDQTDFATYRTRLKDHATERNEPLREVWGDRYIDLLDRLANEEDEILVFTPQGQFMSQDTEHLTRAGATYIAEVIDDRLGEMLGL